MGVSATMYKLLVEDPDDVFGALAYTAYKKHEVEVMDKILADTGSPPSQADIDAFQRAASSAAAIEMYLDRAENLVNAFLAETLEARKSQLEIEFARTAIGVQLTGIQAKQNESRTWRGWLADSGGNLAVNILTILLIALLIFGYRALDQWYGELGRRTGALQVEPVNSSPVTDADKLPAIKSR